MSACLGPSHQSKCVASAMLFSNAMLSDWSLHELCLLPGTFPLHSEEIKILLALTSGKPFLTTLPTMYPLTPCIPPGRKEQKCPVYGSVSPTWQQTYEGRGYILCILKYPVPSAMFVQFLALPFFRLCNLGQVT